MARDPVYVGLFFSFQNIELEDPLSTIHIHGTHRSGHDIHIEFPHANMKNHRFATPTDIICNADMRVGEVRQFCSLQLEGQNLMRVAAVHESVRFFGVSLSSIIHAIADLVGRKETQSPLRELYLKY